jgi:hypothetical protein
MASLDSDPYHDPSSVGNASILVRFHVLNQSRSNYRHGILGLEYYTECRGIPNFPGKHLVRVVFMHVDVEKANRQASWPDIPSQILRYSADRTGIMAFANLPLVWVFGGRNNIFLWATGWSFPSFNIFHRHVARVATLQAVVHSILYIVMYIQGKL